MCTLPCDRLRYPEKEFLSKLPFLFIFKEPFLPSLQCEVANWERHLTLRFPSACGQIVKTQVTGPAHHF